MENKKIKEVDKLLDLQKGILEESKNLLRSGDFQSFLIMIDSFLVCGEEIIKIEKGDRKNGK